MRYNVLYDVTATSYKYSGIALLLGAVITIVSLYNLMRAYAASRRLTFIFYTLLICFNTVFQISVLHFMNNQRSILIRAYKTGDCTVTEGVVSNYKLSQTARYKKGSADYRVVYNVKADDGKNIAINYTFSARQPYYGAQPEVNALNNQSGNVVSFDYTSTELIKFITDSKSLHDGTHVRITHADGNVLDLYEVIKYEVAQD